MGAHGFVSTVSDNNQSMPGSVSEESAPAVASQTLPQASGVTILRQEPARPRQQTDEQHGQKDTFEMTQTVPDFLPPPGPNASADDRMEFIHQQLDGFGGDTPMFDDLLPLGCGASERMQGGRILCCRHKH